jgi:hypothetical protein
MAPQSQEPSNRQIFDAIVGVAGDVQAISQEIREMKGEIRKLKEVWESTGDTTPLASSHRFANATTSAPYQTSSEHIVSGHSNDQTMAYLPEPVPQWMPDAFGSFSNSMGSDGGAPPSSRYAMPYHDGSQESFSQSSYEENDFEFGEGSSMTQQM